MLDDVSFVDQSLCTKIYTILLSALNVDMESPFGNNRKRRK